MSGLWPPVVGICGWKGVGKTTLVEALVTRLVGRGLRVGVIKHDAHRLEVDRPSKDTDRYFRAGAEVLAHDEEQEFSRRRLTGAVGEPGGSVHLDEMAARLGLRCDVVLVEGHKESPVPKLWLGGSEGAAPPSGITGLLAVLRRSEAMVEEALALVLGEVEEFHRRLAVFAGVLIGGESRRMGRPKALLPWRGATLLEHTVRTLEGLVERVVLLGMGPRPDSLKDAPCLADVPGVEGPMAGVLAALRWAPRVRWLILPCDLPHLSHRALVWLLEQHHPGRSAVMPRLPSADLPEPLLALYYPPAGPLLERAAEEGRWSLRSAIPPESTAAPEVPHHLAPAWQGVNTPEEWCRIIDSSGREA